MCSFCGKSHAEVSKLIAGPGVYICDACSSVCSNILDKELGEKYRIRRTISFSPEHKQAGISILNYFSRIVEQKYPNSDVRVRVEQVGDEVTLIVESQSGDIERISQTLTDYGRVITGQLEPQSLLVNKVEISELNQKLELAAMELRLTNQLHEQYKLLQDTRVHGLENDVKQLHKLIADGIRSSDSLQAIIVQVTSPKNRDRTSEIIRRLESRLSKAEESRAAQVELEKEVETVRRESPAKFEAFKQFTNSTLANITGNVLSPWFINLINSMPK